MKKPYLIGGVIAVIIAVVIIFASANKTEAPSQVSPGGNDGIPGEEIPGNNNPTPTKLKTSKIEVDSPLINATVSSPLVITGKARTWYFEASFPVTLLDGNGKVLAQGPAQAQGDWMTTEFVPFKAMLTFAQPTTATGTLILQNDNPSGLPENSESVRLPVVFGQNKFLSIKLYYPNTKSGVDVCSSESILPVNRTIPSTQTTLKDSINLLLKGELTAAEKSQGFTTEFPDPGFTLKSATVVDGVAKLTFNDANNFTTGGSCRTSILANAIIKTAKQFSSVKSVVLLPDTLFQP